MLPLLITLPVLLIASAIASGAETALFSLSRADRQAIRVGWPHAGAAVERLLARPRMLLIQVLLFNMVVNVTYFVVTSVLTLRAEDPLFRVGVSVGGVLAIILIGEVLAKLLAASMRRRYAVLIAPPMLAARGVLWPVLAVLDHALIAPLSRLIHHAPDHASQDRHATLQALIESAADQGALDPRERELLIEVVELGRARIRDVMTPRVDVDWIHSGASRDDLLSLARQRGRTTLPVCDGTLDDGVVGLLDVNACLSRPGAWTGVLPDTRAALFVPEYATLDDLLAQLTRRGEHTAIVVDELGAVAGLVAIEDIADELLQGLGSAEDEPSQRVLMVGIGEWLVPGRLPVRELAELFADGREPIAAESRVSTLAGYIHSVLGRVAEVGDQVHAGGLTLTVDDVEDRAITRVRVTIAGGGSP